MPALYDPPTGDGADTISIVITHRKSKTSLKRLLDSLAVQKQLIAEVIILHQDADEAWDDLISDSAPPLKFIPSGPSTRTMINRGFQEARTDYVLLCHDDVELPKGYLAALRRQAELGAGAVSGMFLVPGETIESSTQFPIPSLSGLCYRFLFQLPICYDLQRLETGSLGRPIARLLKRYYGSLENQFTRAGWPLITQMDGPAFRVKVWPTLACLIRRDWYTPFDENLEADGTAECLELSMKLPGPITVTREVGLIYYGNGKSLVDSGKEYFKRFLTLHYLMRENARFGWTSRLWLKWSLLGAYLDWRRRGSHEKAVAGLTALRLIFLGKNPYLHGRQADDIELNLAERRQGVGERRCCHDRRDGGDRRNQAERRRGEDRRRSVDRRLVVGRRRVDFGGPGDRRVEKVDRRQTRDRRSGRNDRRRPVKPCFPELGFL
ncbi:MAG: glycosyltransferase family A protein [Acidobacteriota bacterium]|nr:glycosyltransferase family A protein [Acidobacteriota bacterium]